MITPDHREATLAFGIRLMPLARQQRVIDYMRSQLHPPPGVHAALAGLPVLAAEANGALSSSSRRLLTLLAGLLAVGLVLAIVFRGLRRAVVPMVPIAFATGWSALILFLIGIPLNPMSATLGTLVIAISTEFSVLLSERFRQERAAGHDLQAALARTYRSTGAAVLASGITAIVGFGVLVLSNITMLRDFGFVTIVDLSVSLGGVLLVLPAVLVLSERGGVLARVRALPGAVAATVAAQAPAASGVSDESGEPPPIGGEDAGDRPPATGQGGPDAADLLRRLDPERASAERQSPPAGEQQRQAGGPEGPADEEDRLIPFGTEELPRSIIPSPVIDTRRYRWMIGIFGLTLVIVVSIYQFLPTALVRPGSRRAAGCTTSRPRWRTRT